MTGVFTSLPPSRQPGNVAARPFRAFRGDEPYVFVCYAHADAEAVYEDLERLDAADVRIWYDEGIEPGNDWRDELARSLAGCSLFLFFASRRSLASGHCRQELNFALNRERRILVVYLEALELPPALEFSLADRQAIERHRYAPADYLERLLDAIRERSAAIGSEDAADRPSERRSRDDAGDDAPEVPERSLAVLPLRTIGVDDDFLGEGIAAELVSGLARIRDLKVAARSQSFAQAEFRAEPARIADRLGVRHVLDGTLRRSGDRLRVTTDLYDSEAGHTIWSERYDRVIDDIFDVQEDIANAVAEALRSEFGIGLGREVVDVGTRDPGAYQAYLQACHSRFQYTPDALARTCAHLRDAIEADGNFLEAHLLLVSMLEGRERLYGEDHAAEIAAVEARAHALDPHDLRVNWFWVERTRSRRGPAFSDPDEDEALFRAMILHAEHPAASGVNPDRWFAAGFDFNDQADPRDRALGCYALLLAQAGLAELALVFFERSRADSFSQACCMLALGRDEDALAFLMAYRDRAPEVVLPRIGLTALLQRLGRWDEARQEAERIDHLLNDDLRTIMRMQTAFWRDDSEALMSLAEGIDALSIPPFFKGVTSLYHDVDVAARRMVEARAVDDLLLRNIRLFVPFFLPMTRARALYDHPLCRALLEDLRIGEAWQRTLAPRAEALLRRLDADAVPPRT